MISKHPKVSVLMPVYRTDEQFLREAIESILNQTFRDFEFLILDDCPEYSREDIVKSYKDNRIKYYKNKKNLGISSSRNKLISLATGELLAVMDHDDVSMPTRFEKQVAYLDSHPNVGVVGSWRQDFPTNEIYKFPENDIEIKKLLTEICAITHPAAMIRKSVLVENKLAYKEKYSPAEDYALWLKLIDVTNFHNIQEVLFKYRIHSRNTSNVQMQKMQEATDALHAWAINKYPWLYQKYLDDRTRRINVLLFGVIPLLKIIVKQKKIKFYLFGVILFLVVNRKMMIWPK